MKGQFRWYDGIFLIVFFYLFILQIQAIWPFTIDDMYISLRYAKHWASGAGLVWNVHQVPVEGYSNFSFVALGALSLLLKINPVVILKGAGICGLFFTCYFSYLITRFWFGKRISLLPCLGLLFYKGQIIWATSGLETTVYEALICGGVYFCFKGMGYCFAPHPPGKPQNKPFLLAGLLFAVASFTRPEAPFLMGLFFLLICWEGVTRADSRYWRGVSQFILAFFICYLPYFGWRFYYFGYLFPNSVYCKGWTDDLGHFLDISYLKLVWPLALLAFPACLRAKDKRHYFLWLPSLAYLIMLSEADPIVAFDNRLFLPAFVLLLPLVLQGIDVIILWYMKRKEDKLLVLFFILTFFFFIPSMTLGDYRYFSQDPVKGEQLRRAVLDWLFIHASPKESVVLSDSGMIPYYSDLNFIDSYCLNNLSMAHSLAKQRYEHFCQEILVEQPNTFILTSLVQHGRIIYTPSDVCLKKRLDKQKNYKLIQVVRSESKHSFYRYELYRHSDE